MKNNFQTYLKLVFALLLSTAIGNFSFAQFAFELPDRKTENLRAFSYSEITVGVSGKLALCSHSERGSIILDVKGGEPPYSFKWNNLQTTKDRTNLYAGTYTVEITDQAGRKHVESIVVQPPFPLILNSVEKRDASCGSSANGYAKLSVKVGRGDGYTNKWSNGLVNVWETDQLAPGVYTVAVFDKFNCDVTVSFEIKAEAEGLQVSSQINDVSCGGQSSGAIKLQVSGGVAPYTYKWSNGAETDNLAGLKAGMYNVLISDQKGCTLESSFLVRDASPISLSGSVVPSTCAGKDGAVSLNVEGGKAPYTYLWNNGSTSSNLKDLAPGVYSVKVSDALGCSVEKQFTINQAEGIKIELVKKEDATCEKATGFAMIKLGGSGSATQIKWSDGVSGKTQRDDLAPGTYTVTALAADGCEVSTSFEINSAATITAKIQSMLDVDCAKGTVTGLAWVSIQGGKEPYKISWSTGAKDLREINFFKSELLKVSVTDALGCSITIESKVDFPNQNSQGGRLDFNYRKLEISNEPQVQIEEEVIFESVISSEFIAWEWSFGDGAISREKDPIHTFKTSGEFEVILTAYDIFGCSSTESNRIQVSNPIELVSIPNAFTPNGDGLNDEFIPKIKAISSFTMDIFNTWGERIYSTVGVESKGWNGTYQGQMLPAGNYMYRITYSSRDGKQFEKTGGITLIR